MKHDCYCSLSCRLHTNHLHFVESSRVYRQISTISTNLSVIISHAFNSGFHWFSLSLPVLCLPCNYVYYWRNVGRSMAAIIGSTPIRLSGVHFNLELTLSEIRSPLNSIAGNFAGIGAIHPWYWPRWWLPRIFTTEQRSVLFPYWLQS